MTLRTFARKLDLSKAEIMKEVKLAEMQSAVAFRDEGRKLSRGTLTYAELDWLDHPYATRHGGAWVPGDPAIINFHSGEFYMAWKIIQPTVWGMGVCIRTTIRNDSKVAAWLDEGTKYMIARPFTERIIERQELDRWHRLDDAVTRALNKLRR